MDINDLKLAELEQCREDERSGQSQMIEVISAAGTILSVILGISIFRNQSFLNLNS
ncbi:MULTISPECIES: hypothetical protein [Bacillota]|jgi:hypothetical protein|uniref:Uncharacterized protein n=2 Tax=Amedibacillus TaxID=2749846 RepID=A0A7G9GKR8_9FIRM|nr:MULTISPECIES: hypothetical protein [Bacillota]MCH4284586.1 hypothetical protein [Amedibacillus hominis]QNM11400.1 hypothetical protein H9Q80_14235 [[Eubacterium] hominis]